MNVKKIALTFVFMNFFSCFASDYGRQEKKYRPVTLSEIAIYLMPVRQEDINRAGISLHESYESGQQCLINRVAEGEFYDRNLVLELIAFIRFCHNLSR